MKKIKIADRKIGRGEKCFIISEIGVNHNGKIDLARKMVDKSIDAGADAVKIQAFFPENSTSKYALKAEYQKDLSDNDDKQFRMLKKLQLSKSDIKNLKQYCDKKNIFFLCTVSDIFGADFVYSLDVDFLKIGSPDIINIPLLRHISKWKLPIVISTGMSNISEVFEAVEAIKKEGNKKIVLLHCVSNYPTKFKDVNLKAMLTLKERFNFPVGFSDHTIGPEVSIAAVAMGANIIEKHFTLDKKMKGPDHESSIEFIEFRDMIKKIRNVESSFGDGLKKIRSSEKEIALKSRRSLVANRDIKKGEVFTIDMVGIKKPFTGLKPKYLDEIIGQKSKTNIKEDQPITWKNVEMKK